MKKSILLLTSVLLAGNAVYAQEVSLAQKVQNIKAMSEELDKAELQVIGEYAFLKSLQASLEAANYIENLIGLDDNKNGTVFVGVSSTAAGLLITNYTAEQADNALKKFLPSGEKLKKIVQDLKSDKKLLKKLNKDLAVAQKASGPTALIENEINLAKGRIAQNTLIKPGLVYKAARYVRIASRAAIPVAVVGSFLVIGETGLGIVIGKDKMQQVRDIVAASIVEREAALEAAGIF